MLLIKDQKTFLVAALISILVLVTITAVQFYNYNKQIQRDEFTRCLGEIEKKYIFIIDKSSAMSIQTQTEILFRIQQQLPTIKIEDFVSIYQIDSQSLTQLQPIFQSCKTDTDFEQDFLQKAKNSIYSNSGHSSSSPLAEALLDINLSHQQTKAKHTKIFIYSDLLQNSQHLNFSKVLQPADAIEQFKVSRLGSVQRPTFINTFVYLHIIPQAELSEQVVKTRDGFWMWFFGDMRGDRQSYSLERHDLPGSYTR